jgi:helicase
MLDQQENMTESETDAAINEASPSMIRIELLRQMLLTGLEKQQASLTLINGLGTKMIKRLLELGINNLNDLKETNPVHLGTVKGLSEKRAKRWIEDAREVQIKIPPDITAYRLNSVASEISLSVDPYRLRRALSLEVKFLESGEWRVNGGSEPRYVTKLFNNYKCTCPDFSKGNHCKHIMAVQLEMNDPELSASAKKIKQSIQHPYLELFGLWFQ